jgi:hypothetical protein
MRTQFASACLAFALPALAACSHPRSLASFEGHIVMHTTKPGGEVHDLTLGAKGDKLRFDMTGPDGSPSHAVYDASTNQMLMFLEASKKYMSLDFSAPSAAPNTSPSTSTITKAGTHKTVAGYDCEQWSVKDAAGHRSEVCIAQGIAYFDPTRLRPGATQEPETALAKEFREKKSFPLESIEYDAAGKELSRMEVQKIDATSVPDADFAIPDGFSKIDRPAPKPKGP